MMEVAFPALLRDFGPIIGVILFFIWRDWKREDKLQERVTRLERYQQDTLVKMVQDTTAALTQNTEFLKWSGRIIEGCQGRKDG
jgi:hypothetical protein